MEITWGNLSGLFGLFVTIMMAFAGFAWWIEGRFSRAREERLQQLADTDARLTKQIGESFERGRTYTDTSHKALYETLGNVRDEGRNFQMAIYKDFVREKSLSDTEARIMGAVAEVKQMLEGLRTQRTPES